MVRPRARAGPAWRPGSAPRLGALTVTANDDAACSRGPALEDRADRERDPCLCCAAAARPWASAGSPPSRWRPPAAGSAPCRRSWAGRAPAPMRLPGRAVALSRHAGPAGHATVRPVSTIAVAPRMFTAGGPATLNALGAGRQRQLVAARAGADCRRGPGAGDGPRSERSRGRAVGAAMSVDPLRRWRRPAAPAVRHSRGRGSAGGCSAGVEMTCDLDAGLPADVGRR